MAVDTTAFEHAMRRFPVHIGRLTVVDVVTSIHRHSEQAKKLAAWRDQAERAALGRKPMFEDSHFERGPSLSSDPLAEPALRVSKSIGHWLTALKKPVPIVFELEGASFID